MTDTRLVWLLDLDGVLNVNSRNGWHEPSMRRYAYCRGEEAKIRWSPSLLDRVRKIVRSGLVDVRWATSWVGYTRQIETMMGLPPLPEAFTLPDVIPPGVRLGDLADVEKKAVALDVVSSGRRLLWTDDEAIWPAGSPEHTAALDAGALLIVPDERRGLQRHDMDAIDAWIAAPSSHNRQ